MGEVYILISLYDWKQLKMAVFSVSLNELEDVAYFSDQC